MSGKRAARAGHQGVRLALPLLLTAAAAVQAANATDDLTSAARTVLGFACTLQDADEPSIPPGFSLSGSKISDIPGRPARARLVLSGENGREAEIVVDGLGGPVRRIFITLNEDKAPAMQIRARAESTGSGSACFTQDARRIESDTGGMRQEIVLLDSALTDTGERIPLNPPVPEGTDPGGVTVAHIDSGVNYLLPRISAALARDDAGKILGHDYWDGDDRPFDIDLSRSPFFPLHHGTTVASLLLKEAPAIRLIPMRYPRPDMSLMGDAVDAAAKAGARIVAMPMGSRDPGDWTAFAQAARAHPDMLFVVSAGNDGRDIGGEPLYPAVLDLPNMLVITSADDFGRIAQGSNWGAESVDLMVPAERVEVTDHRGATVSASGSSYAVPRVAALAARLLEKNPDWKAADLIAAIAAYAAPGMDRGPARVKFGWIPDPANLP